LGKNAESVFPCLEKVKGSSLKHFFYQHQQKILEKGKISEEKGNSKMRMRNKGTPSGGKLPPEKVLHTGNRPG